MTKIEITGRIVKTSHSNSDISWDTHEFDSDDDISLEDAFDELCSGWTQKVKITIETKEK